MKANNNLSGGMLKGKLMTVIYKGGKLLWQAGNFFTKDNRILYTKDGSVFNVKK